LAWKNWAYLTHLYGLSRKKFHLTGKKNKKEVFFDTKYLQKAIYTFQQLLLYSKWTVSNVIYIANIYLTLCSRKMQLSLNKKHILYLISLKIVQKVCIKL